MINQTHIGPMIVSNKKKRFTSAAGINLGAIVTNTNGIATHKIHIRGTMIRSLSKSAKLSIKNRANVWKFQCKGYVDDELVSEAVISAMIMAE